MYIHVVMYVVMYIITDIHNYNNYYNYNTSHVELNFLFICVV